MPFSPLPKSVVDKLEDLDTTTAVAVDLGCGDGGLTRLLSRRGLQVFGLDRMPPGMGTSADIVADALRPPLADGSVDLLLAGNLVRHLLVDDPRAAFLTRWRRTLSRTGWLLILEDEPVGDRPATRNYAAVQDFLQRLTSGRRGPLLPLRRFRQLLPESETDVWSFGARQNRYPLDVSQVLALLAGDGDVEADSEVGRLSADIRRDGIECGEFWWAFSPGLGR